MRAVYAIIDKVDGRRYIGATVDYKDRKAHHISSLRNNRHDSKYLQEAFNKHGEENFDFEILQEYDDTYDRDMLGYEEQKYIKQYKSDNREFGFNIEGGGHKGKIIGEETRKYYSEIFKGRFTGENSPCYGKHFKHTEEWKKWASERFSGKGNPMYGVHLTLTEERRKAISERTKGEKNPFYGKKHTEETKEKIRKTRKRQPVRCVETGICYESYNDAEKKTNIHNSSIRRAALNSLTAGGYHWELA